MASGIPVHWQLTEVKSPHLTHPVSTVAAINVPYSTSANRLQNLNIYLLLTDETSQLVGHPVVSLPSLPWTTSTLPRWQVHVHGGAWRAPELTSTSIEAAVAHAFAPSTSSSASGIAQEPRILAVASLNYTISPYPEHKTQPYDPVASAHSDLAREAVHPDHVRDVLHGFALLKNLGLADGEYILTGHSCGACLSLQAILQPPSHWGLDGVPDAPRPAALVGLNGLYDLPGLVHDLGDSHAWISEEYKMLQGHAFGSDEAVWEKVSPARFGPKSVEERIKEGKAPNLILLDASTEDQLVPTNQVEKLRRNLGQVSGLSLVKGHRCVGRHAAPWEEGYMIWETVKDVLEILQKKA